MKERPRLRTRFDQLSKGILSEVLRLLGRVQTQYEIAGEVQAADLLFQPEEGHEAERTRLGLIGRMTDRPCLLEPFHASPTGEEALDCVCKLLTLRRQMRREASKQGGPPPVMPRLWLLSAGRPETVIRGLELTVMEGWPTGFWQASPLLDTCLVVLRDLPETRDSLLLRVVGAGTTFRNAAQELRELPEDAWEVAVAIPLLLAFRVEFPQDPEEDDMQYAEELRAIYDKWAKQVWEEGRNEGRDEGRDEGIRKTLLSVYRARFGEVPPDLATSVEATDDDETLAAWAGIFATRTPEEIAAAVRSGTGR